MIEKVIYEHLQQCTELEPYLTTYAGKMAVFNQEAPADTDKLWTSGSQYGRVVFTVNMQDDMERKISGTMGIDVICKNGQQSPEEIEPIMRSLVDGYFFSTETVTIAAQWNASRYFTEPMDKVNGVTITFKLLAFPKQTTIEPDPIDLINQWSSKELPEAIGKDAVRVIGRDELPAAWKPTNGFPAIFWRLGNTASCEWIPDTYNCCWFTTRLHGHILVPNNATALIIARIIKNVLAIKKRLLFEDMAPLMVDRNIQVFPANDPLRSGQISIDATYGILNNQENVAIEHINIT